MLQIVKKDSTEPIKVALVFWLIKLKIIQSKSFKIKKNKFNRIRYQKAFSNHADVASMLKISKCRESEWKVVMHNQ